MPNGRLIYHPRRRQREVGDVHLWVSGDRFPDFNSLRYDLVFVVAEKCAWTTSSFQAQTAAGELIDIVPMLERQGIALDVLHRGMRAGFRSRPMAIGGDAASAVAAELGTFPICLRGSELQDIRRQGAEL